MPKVLIHTHSSITEVFLHITFKMPVGKHFFGILRIFSLWEGGGYCRVSRAAALASFEIIDIQERLLSRGASFDWVVL